MSDDEQAQTDNPVVSIVIPVYNDATTLSRAVQSCLNQTLSQIEVVIVDDASTDGSVDVARNLFYSDARIHMFVHDTNKQSLETRRDGALEAHGDYVLFLDADDWLDLDVCERTVAVARQTGADIVHFSIVPEYGSRRPPRQTVEGRARMYAAKNLTAHGEDVVHATYRDDQVVWSICGKLFSRELLERASAHIPTARMFQSEDAYIYFVIAVFANTLVSQSDLPVYHYAMGIGDTRADAAGITADQFDAICRNSLAAQLVNEFLAGRPDSDIYIQDVKQLRFRLLADPTTRFPQAIAPDDRPAAFDALMSHWPSWEAIGWLAARHWDDPIPVMEAIQGAQSIRVHQRNNDAHDSQITVAVFFNGLGTGDDERVTRDQIMLWRSMGYRVVFLYNETDETQALTESGNQPDDHFNLSDDIQCVSLPSNYVATGGRYPQRAQALHKALVEYDVDIFVYSQWLSLTLPWDLLVTKTLGIPFVIQTHGNFSVLVGNNTPEFLELAAAYRLADGVVTLSAADKAFWLNFNDRSWRTQNMVDAELLNMPAALLNGHDMLWVGRISCDKNPLAALDVLHETLKRVPDARLVIAGSMDPAMRDSFIQHMTQLGVTDCVVLLGDQTEDEMRDVYQKAALYIMTSHYEGYPMALAESKAAGIPCVMYDLPYLTLVQGKSGVVRVKVDDTEAFGLAASELLLDNPSRHRLGEQAREHMKQLAHFDCEALWDKVFCHAFSGEPAPDFKSTDQSECNQSWNILISVIARQLERKNAAEYSVVQLQNNIEQKQALINNQQSCIDTLTRELSDVRASFSLRVGRALTAPLRDIRDFIRRRQV